MFYTPSRSFALERFLNEARRGTGGPAFEQDEKSYTLTFDLPGVAKSDLEIGIEGTVVRLSTKEGAPRTYKYGYEFALEIDSAASEAKLENGVLTLKLAKKVPVSNVAQLAIQ